MTSDKPRVDINIPAPCRKNQHYCTVFPDNDQNIKSAIDIIWCDASIKIGGTEQQHTLSHLQVVNEQITMFTNDQECLQYMNGLD